MFKMEERKKKSVNGITLIALVVTIIILLILSGISISALTNQGILRNAKEAKNRTENAQKEEQELLNQYEDELNKNLAKNNEKEEKLIDKVNDGTVKIGDYIKYTPDIANTDSILQELSIYSGSDANTTSTLTQENLNWRVLDVKDGQVRLISEVPTTSKITLYGYNGYNNAVKLLDDTCNTLYNNSKLASKVQNLKLEDIKENMVETDYSNIDSRYGKIINPTNTYYPSIFSKEKEQKVNGTLGTELGLSEQTELIKQTEVLQANSLEVKYTGWLKQMLKEDFKDNKYYELFINNGNDYKTYWMSSRFVLADNEHIDFYVSRVHSGYVTAYGMYSSFGNGGGSDFSFRPVITLKSDVLIDATNLKDGSSAEKSYVIK